MTLQWRGVNMPAYAFDKSPPYTYGSSYVCPGFDLQTGTTWNGGSIPYFIGKGFNCFPLQVQWEILQPVLGGALSSEYLNRISRFCKEVIALGGTPIVTPHFKLLYNNTLPTQEQFASFIGALGFGLPIGTVLELMSEPAGAKVETWVNYANAAIAKARQWFSGDILVGLGGYSGVRSFAETWYGEKSSTALLRITDPLNKVTFSAHHYSDVDYSGQFLSGDCSGVNVSDELFFFRSLTVWARTNNKKLFLGEFGSPVTTLGAQSTKQVLDHLTVNADVWRGFAWWYAGPWIAATDPLKLEPESYANPVDKPQMSWLAPYLAPVSPAPPPEKTYTQAELDAAVKTASDASYTKGFEGMRTLALDTILTLKRP